MIGILSAILSGLSALFLRVGYSQSFPPPLSQKEERECFEKMKKGDRTARDTLIEHNMRLVAHIVKKYYTSSDEQEDLISIGTVGLIKAIDSFNCENGARFATYASKCLQNEILMHFRAQKKTAGEVLLGDAIDTDKDGNPLTYIDIISVDDTIAEDLDARLSSRKALSLVNRILDEREREIVLLRFGLSGKPPIPQREVAQKLGISRSYVSRIEKAALEKLEKALRCSV